MSTKSKCVVCHGPLIPPRKKCCSAKCDGVRRSREMAGNKLRVGKRPANAFVAGGRSWNAGMKGIHMSPATEFKPGRESDRKAAIGAVTIRVRKRDKKPRAWVKIAMPNVWRPRAVVVWEKEHGTVPRGSVVHHKDESTLNDSPDNLELQTRAQHIDTHRATLRKGSR
jgi:hypothetical protein